MNENESEHDNSIDTEQPDVDEVEVGDVLRVVFDGQVVFAPEDFASEVVQINEVRDETIVELECGRKVKCMRGEWFYQNLGTRVELASNTEGGQR